jgi:hypothetical protein
MKLFTRLTVAAAFFFVCSFLSGDAGALTADQCTFFSTNGQTAICHRTGSASSPYVRLEISTRACVSGHAGHASDYAAFNDSTCNGSGSFPEGAPCDGTVECSEGLSCQSGICRAPHAGAPVDSSPSHR